MKFTRFEDIIAWKKAKELTNNIYKIFKKNQDYSFKNQIQRAAISVINNISEGYERISNKEFRNFLSIAKGSVGEIRSMLYIARDQDYIDIKQFNYLYSTTLEIAKILSGLIKTL